MTTKTDILQIKLEVDGDGKVKASLAGVEQSLNANARATGGLGSQFNALKGAVAALGLGYLAKQFLDLTASMDATAKAAGTLGTTTEKITEMKAAFRAAGADDGNLERMLRQMSARAAEAAHVVGGETAAAFRELGLNARDLARLSPDEQFRKIADALGNVANGGERARLGNAIFSREYEQVSKVVTAGRDAFNAAAQEAREFGAVLSSDTARKAELFNDNLGRMGLIAQGMGNTIAAAALPALIELSDQFIKAYKEAGGFKKEIESLTETGLKGLLVTFQALAVVGSDVAFVFKGVGGELGVIAAQIAAVARGDFSGAKFIGEEWKRDVEQARADLDEFQKRIMDLRIAPGGDNDTSPEDDKPKPGGGALSGGSPAYKSEKFSREQRLGIDQIEFETRLLGQNALARQIATEKRKIDVAVTRMSWEATNEEAAAYRRAAETLKDDLGSALEESYTAHRRWEVGARNAFQSYAEDATNAALQTERVLTTSIKAGEDAFVKSMRERRLALEDFGRALEDIAYRTFYQTQIAGPMAQFMGSFDLAGLFGGGTNYTDYSGGSAYMTPDIAAYMHTGGIVGDGGDMRAVPAHLFDGARRFHTGGMIGSDEVPIVARRGEGVFTPQQMRALGGGAGNVRVEIINNGTPQEVVSAQPSLDADGMVVRVFMRDLRSGGPASRAIADTFNLRRSGG